MQDQDSIIAEINITPLTDVMLVLLIIFMVTATFFVIEPAMKVSLPAATTSQRELTAAGQIRVTISRAGKIHIGREAVARTEVVTKLMDAAKRTRAESKVVVIRADRRADYGTVIWVMDAARLVGLRRVSLSTEPAAGDSR